MSRSGDVDALLDEARGAGLKVEVHGTKWRAVNPVTGGQLFLPRRAIGRGLMNFRTKLKRLAAEKPSPMVAATSTTPIREEPSMGWPVPDLLAEAEKQGVRVDRHGGLLRVVGPVEAEPLSRLIRDREPEVLAHLNPPTDKDESSMPQLRSMARVGATPVENLASDAQGVWSVLREKAKADGDEPGSNAGNPGVLWRGALNRVMRELAPDWDDDYRKKLSQYLDQTGNARCQSKHANPPIWWISGTWQDGGLTVTRTAPKPAPPRAAPHAMTDEELLRVLAARLAGDPRADAKIAELEQANEALRSHVEELTTQLRERDARLEAYEAAAAVFRGGPIPK